MIFECVVEYKQIVSYLDLIVTIPNPLSGVQHWDQAMTSCLLEFIMEIPQISCYMKISALSTVASKPFL